MTHCTAFSGPNQVSTGSIAQVAAACHSWIQDHPGDMLLVFEDHTGRVLDLDLRGDVEQVLDQLDDHPLVSPPEPHAPAAPRGRGRPRLGVVSREVSLLPRHWAWLERQPRSLSATLRSLIEEHIRRGAEQEDRRRAEHAAYGVMSVLAGDLPGFEEATRALFAHDTPRVLEQIEGWPPDVQSYLVRLLGASAA